MNLPRYSFVFKLALLLLPLLCVKQQLNAQLKASFTVDVTSGCSPMEVQFTNTSTGNPTSFKWFVGINSTPFELENPKATYVSGGNYTVKLIISDGVSVDSIIQTNLIHVFDKPVVNFSATVTEACAPFSTAFTDLSSANGGGSIVSRSWAFGNSTASTLANPTANYTASGFFNVSLLVTDNNGCSNSKQVASYIHAKKQPSALFSGTNIKACNPPVSPVLTAQETGGYNFKWMVDGNEYTGNPLTTLTLNNSGSFDVTLQVSDGMTCNSTLTQSDFVVIAKPVADFSFPDTICSGKGYKFNSLATGGSTYLWRFGDTGSLRTETNAIYSFNEGGVFPVTHIVTSPDGMCKDSITKNVTVDKPIANFSPQDVYDCGPEKLIDFTNLSTGASEYRWVITDHQDYISTNVSVNFDAGDYEVILYAKTFKGCLSIDTGKVAVHPLRVGFDYEPRVGGCAPLKYSFQDTTGGDYPIVSWDWDFGDGSAHGTNKIIDHVVNEPSAPVVHLTVRNGIGCVEDVNVTIMAGAKPSADFTQVLGKDCPKDPEFFFDQTTIPGYDKSLVDSWRWHFYGDVTLHEQNPTHTQEYSTGYVSVELISGFNGCLDTVIKPNLFYKFGPIVRQFDTISECIVARKARFRVGVYAFNSFKIDFADGTNLTVKNGQQSFALNRIVKGVPVVDSVTVDSSDYNYTYIVEHTFADTGHYVVEIDALLDSVMKSPYTHLDTAVYCTFPDSLWVYVPAINAQITPQQPDSVCPATTVRFVANNPGEANWFEWYVDDYLRISGYNYRTLGFNDTLYADAPKRNIKLVVRNLDGCADTAKYSYTIIKPRPVITTTSPTTGCSPLKVVYRGSDTSGVPIISWNWNFGANAAPSFSFKQFPDTVVYTIPDENEVTLTVMDKFGCTNSVELGTKITIAEPEAKFVFTDTSNVCFGAPLKFTNQSEPKGQLSFKWLMSTGDTFTTEVPNLSTDTVGDFTVTLIAGFGNGCSDTLVKPFRIEPNPQIDFSVVGPLESNCYPFVNVQFESSVIPANFPDYLYEWDLGESSTGNGANAVTNYFSPGEYDVRLKVTTPAGCVDSIIKPKLIKVRGPKATLTISDDSVCVKDNILFVLSNVQNMESFSWDFGDGNIDPGSVYTVSHSYMQVGDIYPVVVIKSGDCEIPLTLKLFVNDVVARFSLPSPEYDAFRIGVDTLKGCESFSFDARFIPSTLGYIDFFEWSIPANSLYYHDTTLLKTFGIGQHAVNLFVSDEVSGCKDQIVQRIAVHPKPIANAGQDQALCFGDSIQLSASGGVKYEWLPITGLSNSNSGSPWANPTETMSYQVRVENEFGCSDLDSLTIFRDKTNAAIVLDSHIGCDSLLLELENQSYGSSYAWLFDNGNATTQTNPNYTFYGTGEHTIFLRVFDLNPNCADTLRDTVYVYPSPTLILDNNKLICSGDSVYVNGSFSGIEPIQLTWTPNNGISNPVALPVYAKPEMSTNYSVAVTDKYCVTTKSIIVLVDKALAEFKLDTNIGCGELPVQITNLAVGNIFDWTFAPGETYQGNNPQHTYTQEGIHTIRLIATDLDPICADTTSKTIRVYGVPFVTATGDGFICNYDSLFLVAAGSSGLYSWFPVDELKTPDSVVTWCYADTTTWYVVTVTDTNGCTAHDTVLVEVQPDYTYLIPLADTINIGDYIFLDATASDNSVFYQWSPALGLECSGCPSINPQLFKSGCFTVSLVDNKFCYPKSSEVCIVVNNKLELDVPNAFTPNSDGRNDKIYARGLGIKQLIKFSIYNRWGEVVFETSDINVGWDGKYKDKVQNDETYVFTVDAEMWDGQVYSKKGYITLLK